MTVELIISAGVIVALGAMIVLEWTAAPTPEEPKRIGWRAIVLRADSLLAGCIVLSLLIIWLPWLFRR